MSTLLQVRSWDDIPRSASAGAILITAIDGLPGDAASGLGRLDGLDIPSVALTAGSCGPADLALLLRCSCSYVDPTTSVDLADAAAVLASGLTWWLERRGAGQLLFRSMPLDGASVVTAGLAIPGSLSLATESAERLAGDQDAALLVRSLRAARRNAPTQSRNYDAELAALLMS